MSAQNDPVGEAILDFDQHGIPAQITVSSDICDDDVIDVPYLFRTLEQMPELETTAIRHCTGSVLDIGAAAGVHAKYLVQKGLEVQCIDVSQGCVEYMSKNGLNAKQINFFDLKGSTYDTLLLMMNGIGIAGTLDQLPTFLNHAKSLLNEGGKIICDSTDIKYLYQDDDGAMWVDLNTAYYGNFKFQMKYKEHKTDWFEWLYVDFDTLKEVAMKCGLAATVLFEENDHYLAELRTIE